MMIFVFHAGLPGRKMKESFRYRELLFTFTNGSEVFSIFSVNLDVCNFTFDSFMCDIFQC